MAIAPFLLILLSVASLLGQNVQSQLIAFGSDLSPQLGTIIGLIFSNVNREVSVGPVSGTIGIVVLLFTASLVFLQIRFAFNVIYGLHEDRAPLNLLRWLYQRISAMVVVLLAGVFLILSSFLPGFLRLLGRSDFFLFVSAFGANFVIFTAMFWSIHYFAPSKHPRKRDALVMALISAVFFILGNSILGMYFRAVGAGSIYGAAGTLLVFLIWSYYSSFTLFLSAELFLFFRLK